MVNDISLVFIELGIAIIGLAILTRLASRLGFSAIPLYLLARPRLEMVAFCPFNSAKNLFILARPWSHAVNSPSSLPG